MFYPTTLPIIICGGGLGVGYKYLIKGEKNMVKYFKFIFSILIVFSICFSIEPDSSQINKEQKGDYQMVEPGTISFTVGVKIKGKFEKPQVLIFLVKEKSQYREMNFSYSFKEDILTPLPFIPIKE